MKYTPKRHELPIVSALFIVLFAGLGTYLLVSSHAAVSCTTTISSGLATAISNAAPGSTICLSAGNYGALNLTTNKSSMVTITPASSVTSSQVQIGYTQVNNSSNLTFDNVTVAGFFIGIWQNSNATHVHFTNDKVTDGSCIVVNTANEDILLDHDDFTNAGQGCEEGRVSIVSTTGNSPASTTGVTISNSLFTGQPSGSGSDGINETFGGGGVQIGPGDQFVNFIESQCNGVHCDPIQFYGAGKYNSIIDDYFYNNSDGGTFISNSDGSTTWTGNVVGPVIGNQMVDVEPNDVLNHNTFVGGITIGCGSGGANGTACATGVTYTNNIGDVFLGGGVTNNSESTWTVNHNLTDDNSAPGAGSIVGSPTFTGGTSPNTLAGFQLTASSLGHLAASDGSDIGSNYFGSSGSGSSSCATGDLNGDSHVNIFDLSILLSQWQQSGVSQCNGDLNQDGTVNIFDLSILLSHYGT